MAISLDVPITAYTRGGTTFVYYKQQKHYLEEHHKKKKLHLVPSKLGLVRSTSKEKGKQNVILLTKTIPRIQFCQICISNDLENMNPIKLVKISVHVLYMNCIVTQLLIIKKLPPVECQGL
jgi:hypothetical protein